eukprot:7054241-Lingulodinium_polyedra.AAC.1
MIPFCSPALQAQAVEFDGAEGSCLWCADATFQTNVQDLVLTAIGPAGLAMDGSLPSMRWLPA